ncbi:MAG: winged helix-turn-helix transcriptional regulator [Crenarchaeota archaeon]|nr:winged helix-turn-helix transcriptional regulator [Thermoproteota archaeon]
MSSNKKLTLEDLLASKTRLRILRVLFEHCEINITKLTKMTELNHKVVQYHLDVLKEYGIIEEKHIGRIKIVKIRDKDPRVAKLRELFLQLFEMYESDSEDARRVVSSAED